jgi:hypothetical protein
MLLLDLPAELLHDVLARLSEPALLSFRLAGRASRDAGKRHIPSLRLGLDAPGDLHLASAFPAAKRVAIRSSFPGLAFVAANRRALAQQLEHLRLDHLQVASSEFADALLGGACSSLRSLELFSPPPSTVLLLSQLTTLTSLELALGDACKHYQWQEGSSGGDWSGEGSEGSAGSAGSEGSEGSEGSDEEGDCGMSYGRTFRHLSTLSNLQQLHWGTWHDKGWGDPMRTRKLAQTTALPHLSQLGFCEVDLRSASFSCLTSLASLRSLSINGSWFSQATLDSIATLVQLTELTMCGCSFCGEEDPRRLVALTNLARLELIFSITQQHVAAMAPLFGRLTELCVNSIQLESAAQLRDIGCMSLEGSVDVASPGLEGLLLEPALEAAGCPAQAPRLKALSLWGIESQRLGLLANALTRLVGLWLSMSYLSQGSDEVAIVAERLPQLRVLQLNACKDLAPQALQRLTSLQQLERLCLWETNQDAGQVHQVLQRIKSLKVLVVHAARSPPLAPSNVGDPAAEWLNAAVPYLAAPGSRLQHVVLSPSSSSITRELQAACDRVVARVGRAELVVEVDGKMHDASCAWRNYMLPAALAG